MLRRSLVLVAALVAALVVAASALAAGVTVRVEGKTQTIFGSVPAKVDAGNALQALDLASILGEFYYRPHALVVRRLREPDREVPGRRQRGLGVQGERRLAARRERTRCS